MSKQLTVASKKQLESATSKKLQWHNEKWCVRDIVATSINPNINTDRQFGKLKKSMERDGYVETIVIDIDGTIVAGAHRHKALMEMGLGDTEIDVRVPNRKLTKKEFDRYLIASNALRGQWNFEILREFDQSLLLDLLGEDDLSHLWDDQLEIEDDEFDEEAELAKIKEPTVHLGDLLQLGEHTLLCADATDKAMVQKLVGNNKIDFVDVDGPFNIKYSYQGKNGKYGGAEKDDKTSDEYRAFLKSLIQNSMSVSKPDAHFIFWCDERWVWLLQELYQELGVESKRLCIWIKDNAMPTPKVAFNKCTEFAVYGTIGTPHINDRIKNLNTIANKEVGSGARVIDDVVDLFSIWLAKRLPATSYEHPTQKPPTLHEKALRRCTRVGDAVLDITAGSGSLMVACEQMKRRAFLCEVDPIFATLIKNRYEKISGKKARKLN